MKKMALNFIILTHLQLSNKIQNFQPWILCNLKLRLNAINQNRITFKYEAPHHALRDLPKNT